MLIVSSFVIKILFRVKLNLCKNLYTFLFRYRENNPDITTDFNSASDFKLLLTVLMENIFTFQNSVIISLKVLHCLTKELPGSPLGKQVNDFLFIHEVKFSIVYFNFVFLIVSKDCLFYLSFVVFI